MCGFAYQGLIADIAKTELQENVKICISQIDFCRILMSNKDLKGLYIPMDVSYYLIYSREHK